MDKLSFVSKSLGFHFRDIPSSYMEAVMMNGNVFLHALLNDFHPIREAEESDLIKYEFPQEELGGIIVFSVNVNSTVGLDNANLVGKIKAAYATLKNRVQKNAKLSKVLFSHKEVTGVSIGKFFKGRYVEDDGTTYDETSTSVEVIGVSFELICAIASEIAKDFQQQTVLVKDNKSRRIVLVGPRA